MKDFFGKKSQIEVCLFGVPINVNVVLDLFAEIELVRP